tara:strand:+ start:63 stop:656 length:594 start_codon:yes stop_codon:yes gene_type:complete
MINRKKKIFLIQISLFTLASLLIYFTYYYNKGDQSRSIEKNPVMTEDQKTDDPNKNVFNDVEYWGRDEVGNRYVIRSEIADFDIDKPELINMKIMEAIFYFKDGTILKVQGDYGTYNNKTNDMKFRENIKAGYEENNLFADNLDFLNSKSLVNVYGNVRTDNNQGSMSADKLRFDLSSRVLDISMFDEDKVNLKLKK